MILIVFPKESVQMIILLRNYYPLLSYQSSVQDQLGLHNSILKSECIIYVVIYNRLDLEKFM